MFTNIRKWISAPTFEGNDEKTLSAALLNLILWIFILAASLYGIFAPIAPEERGRRVVIIIPFVIVLLIIKIFVNRGHIRATGNSIVFLLWVLFTTAMALGADYNNPAFMGYLIVVICAGLILNWRASIGWGIFSIITSAIILLLGQNGILPSSSSETPAFAFWVAQTVYIFTSALLLSLALRKIDEARASTLREINERKRVEAEREKVIKELESKNAELERFTYTVSHDLKSPLITIGGFIGLLEEDTRAGDSERVQKDLNRIREAKDKMYQLLNELLELSRIGRMMNEPENMSYNDIINEALALTEGQLTATNTKVLVQENLPTIHGDRPRLVEVMQNLIDNAAKFSADQTDSKIEIGVNEINGERVFFVKDNGIGINPSFHEKIFGLFDKLNPITDGTGVGLALVKRIIEVHGGCIWVELEGKGKGSTFYFTLPEEVI